MYNLADIRINCKNQDLYTNKDDFETFLEKKIIIFNLKDFISISVKCIRCRINGFQKSVTFAS